MRRDVLEGYVSAGRAETDYGVVLDPRPGERRSRFYFSIGQAF